MALKEYYCLNCGKRVVSTDGAYDCARCGHSFKDADMADCERIARAALGHDASDAAVLAEVKRVSRSRSELWQAVHANESGKYICESEVREWCNEFKKLPDDYAVTPDMVKARFFSLLLSSPRDNKKINAFIEKEIIDKDFVFADEIAEFLTVKLESANFNVMNKLFETTLNRSVRSTELKNRFDTKLNEINTNLKNPNIERDIFIAHDSSDRQVAESMLEFLESKGYACFFAPRNLGNSSERYETDLGIAIRRCKIFLFLSSKHSRHPHSGAMKEIRFVMEHFIDRGLDKPRLEFIIDDYPERKEDYTAGDIEAKQAFGDKSLSWCKDKSDLLQRIIKIIRKLEVGAGTPFGSAGEAEIHGTQNVDNTYATSKNASIYPRPIYPTELDKHPNDGGHRKLFDEIISGSSRPDDSDIDEKYKYLPIRAKRKIMTEQDRYGGYSDVAPVDIGSDETAAPVMRSDDVFKADKKVKIGVVGVGGAGINITNAVVSAELSGIDGIIAVDSDKKALLTSRANKRLLIGGGITHGIGCGRNADTGYDCADEAVETFCDIVNDYDVLFFVAGASGGIGGGATVRLVRAARDINILTVAFLITPFDFEGSNLKNNSDRCIAALSEAADSTVVLHNDVAAQLYKKDTTVAAFGSIDEAAIQYIRTFTDIMVCDGGINIDFSDFKAFMTRGGRTYVGSGQASGEGRVLEALQKAVCGGSCDMSITGAQRIIVYLESRDSLALDEVNKAISLIKDLSSKDIVYKIRNVRAKEDAEIIFGYNMYAQLSDDIRITLIATAYDML